jgi:hypothetical protein
MPRLARRHDGAGRSRHRLVQVCGRNRVAAIPIDDRLEHQDRFLRLARQQQDVPEIVANPQEIRRQRDGLAQGELGVRQATGLRKRHAKRAIRLDVPGVGGDGLAIRVDGLVPRHRAIEVLAERVVRLAGLARVRDAEDRLDLPWFRTTRLEHRAAGRSSQHRTRDRAASQCVAAVRRRALHRRGCKARRRCALILRPQRRLRCNNEALFDPALKAHDDFSFART